MIFKSRVKLNHLLSEICSKFKNSFFLFNWSTTSSSGKSFSNFQHNFSLKFLNPQIWNEHFGNIGKQISRHVDFICKRVSIVHPIFIKFSDATSERVQNPFKNINTIIGYFQTCMVIGVFVSSAFGDIYMVSDEKTSFPINETSKVSQVQWSDFRKVIKFEFWHKYPFVQYHTSINEKNNILNHAERLSDQTLIGKRQSELIGNNEREIRRGFPAWKQVTKVTECLNESARLLAQNLAQTMDEVTRDVLASTSSVLQCSNGVNGQTPTELTKADIDAAVKTLLGNDAEMISEVVIATNQFSTTAIRPAFWGYIDTDLLDDLEAVANFVSSSQYPGNQKVVLDSEWGATGNVRWLYTSVGSVSSASPPVYNNFIIGKEAYAVVNLRSETGEFYIKPLGSAGSADPLNQRGSVGWQHPFVSRILNDSFMINLMATHS